MSRGRVLPNSGLDLVEFVLSAGQAHLKTLDLAEPSFADSFGNAGLQVVAYLLQP
ncbi:hypothetical protein [Actinoplanes sp. NPDC051411]|uniref:hypothetical protein n=1 Tax=Actinoplanes sp. NPDC051411 TaxID=3155522 RepID=UPI003436DE7D